MGPSKFKTQSEEKRPLKLIHKIYHLKSRTTLKINILNSLMVQRLVNQKTSLKIMANQY